MKMESESPAAKAAKELTDSGLNQSQEKGNAGASPAACQAAMEYQTSTTICSRTSEYCTALVAVAPR